LSDVTLRSDNSYATLSLFSMDKLPIRTSRKLRVQLGTVVRPSGWLHQDAIFDDHSKNPVQGKRTVVVGHAP
jgi:hypothetical protein